MNFAQVANYTFTQTAGTYTEITGGTVQGATSMMITLSHQLAFYIFI